jgi:gluconolactonase
VPDDELFEVIDDRFTQCAVVTERLETIATGSRFTEGPVYFPAHRYLLWSDIPNDRIMRYDEINGTVAVYREPAGFANGNTRDLQGRLVTCEHAERRIVRTEHDGTLTVLADSFEGRRLNSPNDVVVADDGAVWFTDPTYGIDSIYEGGRAAGEIGRCNVYRIDPVTLACEARAEDFAQPNGLAFSPDGRVLYVADSGYSHDPAGPRHIRRFDVGPDGRLSSGDVVADCPAGVFDGFRIDEDGRMWTSAADGVRCLLPDGTHIGTIRCPESVANVEFGGPRGNLLYICGTTTMYRMMLAVRGAR